MTTETAIQHAAGADVAPLPTDDVSTALAVIQEKNTSILSYAQRGRDLHAQYKDVAFDVSTTKGMDEAAAARRALREEARYPIQRLQKEGSKMLGTMQRQFNEQADKLTKEIEGYELPIDTQIQAEQNRRATEKAAAEQADRERIEAITQSIELIRSRPLSLVGATSTDIENAIGELRAEADEATDEDFAEFAGQARRAYAEALAQLQGMLVAKRMEEEQAAALEAQRLEQAAQQQAIAEQARELQAQQDALRAEREALAAQQQAMADEAAAQARAKQERDAAIASRIEAMRGLPQRLEGASSGNLETNLQTLNDTLVLSGDYGDRQQEADIVRREAMTALRAMLEGTLALEETQRQEAEALRAQQEQDALDRAVREEAERQEAEKRAAQQALLSRQQAAGPQLFALVQRMFAEHDESDLRAALGDAWVNEAVSIINVLEPLEVVADEPAIEVAAAAATVRDRVLKVVSSIFDLPPGEHLLELRFASDIGATGEDFGALLEELGIQFAAEFPEGLPLVLAGALGQSETVADLADQLEKAVTP